MSAQLALIRVISGMALIAALQGAALADPPAPPQGVVNLQAGASAEVPRDLLAVTLSATREGPDAASVQTALKQALDAALAEARKAAKPGQVDLQTGNFALFPRYGKNNAISGWQGSAELQIEGRDMSAIAALTGRITTMTIARVNYSLSRELRDKTESDLAAQAIARYRARAADVAKQFGYAGYTLREVSVSSAEPNFPQPMPRMRAMAASASDEALPVEAGKGVVTIVVSGSVQLTK
jgi:predicted secreted protein